MSLKEFRALILEAMERQGYSLRETARLAGMSPSYLSRVLTGKREPPSDGTLIELAQVLDIAPPELLLIEADGVGYERAYNPDEIEALTTAFRKSLTRRSRKKKR